MLFFFSCIFILLCGRKASAKVPCDPESFEFVDSPRHVERNGKYIFRVANAQELGCAINVTYEWTLYQRFGRELLKIPDETRALQFPGKGKIMINQVDMDKMPKGANDTLQYYALKVVLIPDPTHYPSYRIWYFGEDVIIPKYIAISGGPERTHWMDGYSLWLNTSGIDGDAILANVSNPVWDCVPPFAGVRPPSTLKWQIPEFYLIEKMTHTCTVTVDLPSGRKESASQVIHIRSYAGIPQIEIRCSENCEPANAYEETVLDFYCHSHCQGKKVSWTVRPYSKNYMKGSKLHGIKNPVKNSISFKPKTFKPDSTIDFIAALEEATANYTLHYRMQNPQIKIRCLKNCKTFDPSREMIFQATCQTECDDLNYYWECRPTPAKAWKVNIPQNDTITFPPYSFPNEVDVQLRVQSHKAQEYFNFTTSSGTDSTLTIACKENCKIFDPRLPVVLVAECKSNCKEENNFSYYWTNSLPRPGYHWYDHTENGNRTLIIPANTYRDTDEVEFQVFGGSGNEKFTIVFHTEKAVMEISCIENCDPDETHPNAHKPVKVKVICSSECTYGPYNWWLEPMPEDFNYTAYQVSENGTFFTIPADLYAEGKEVKLSVTKGTGEAFIIVKFLDLKPELEVICLKNCVPPSDPLADTILQVECMKSCDDVHYEWRPEPKPDLWYDHFELVDQNKTLIVKGGTYKSDEVVDFGVFSKNDAEQHLHLTYKTPAVDFFIDCAENCNKSWTSLKTVLVARCFANCLNLGFLWEIKPEPDALKWARSIRFSSDNSTLTILPFTFSDSDKITVKVKIVPTISKVADELQFREAEQTREIQLEFEELLAVLTLICEPSGCNTTVNRLEPVNLSVLCLKHCEGPAYNWELDPLPQGFDWDIHSVRGIENTTLKLRQEAAQENDNITVTVSKGAGKASGYLIFKNPEPEMAIICDENCNASNPQKPVILHAQCLSLCKYVSELKEYVWLLTPAAKLYPSMGPMQETFKILPKSYKDGDIVNATLLWDYKARATLMLSFVEPPPVLEIVCIRNCKYNPKIATTFQVRCLTNCYKKMIYNWIFTPEPKFHVHYIRFGEVIDFPENSYEAYDSMNLTAVSGKGHESKFIIFMDSKPTLTVLCIENCDTNLRANPKKPTIFSVSCESDCDDLNYKWVLDQPPIIFNPDSDLRMYHENSRMVMRANLYKNDTLVRVYVSSGRGNTSLDVYFFEPVPLLVVLCVENCGYPDPYMKLTVNVTCLKNCGHANYTWYVTPQLRQFSWEHNIILGKANETLTVLHDTYEDEEQALFIVQSGDAKAELYVTFTVPPPVLRISCKPGCLHANPFETLLLKVNCLQFCHNPFYLWGLKPTLPGFEWHLNITEDPRNTNTSITIESYTFLSGSDTNAIVVSNKSAYAIAKIHFEVEEPEMAIVCTKNCVFHPWHSVVFHVECVKHCYDFKYNCTVSPLPEDPTKDLKWLLDGSFSIRRRSYHEKDVVTVRCNSRETKIESIISFSLSFSDIKCRIFPNRGGVSGITTHAIDCYSVPRNVIFRIYQQVPGLPTPGVLLWHGPHAYVPKLWFSPSKGRQINLLMDHGWNVSAFLQLTLNEKPFQVDANGTDEKWNAVKYRILGNKLDDFRQLLREQEYQRAIQLASALDTVLEDSPLLFELHYRRHLLEDILIVMNEIEPSQVMSLMSKMAFKNYVYNSLSIYHLLMEGVRSSVERILNWNHTYPQYSKELLHNVSLEALSTSGRIIAFSKFSKGDGSEPIQSEEYFDNEGPKRHLKYLTSDFFRIINAIATLTRVPGQNASVQGGGIYITSVDIPLFEKRQELNFDPSKSWVEVPPFGSNNPSTMLSPFVNVTFHLAYFSTSPLWWDKSVDSNDVEIVSFAIDVQEERIEYAPFEIVLKLWGNSSKPAGKIKTKLLNEADVNVYEFEVPAFSTFQANFTGGGLTLYIGHWYPTLEVIKNNGTTLTENNYRTFYFYSPSTKVYVAISGVGSYTLGFISLQCLNWHGDTWAWDTQNCRVAEPQPYGSFMVCKCSRMSLLTGNRLTPKYVSLSLNAQEPIFGNFKKYWYTEIVIGTVLIVIAIAVIIAFIRDRKNEQQYKLHSLKDNNRNDKVKYIIAVQTGVWKSSGTTARVAVQVIGREAVSRVHLLNGKDVSRLQRNSIDFFFLYTRTHLGEITALRVWHDSSGGNPHWYCNSIVIRDIQAKQRYIFFISRWFSLLWGDGTTGGIFKPKNHEAAVDFDLRMDESLRINHSYLGLLTERATPHSNKQNVAVSSVSLLLTMVVIFFMVPEEGRITLTAMYPAIVSAAFIGVIVSTFLDVLFRMSR